MNYTAVVGTVRRELTDWCIDDVFTMNSGGAECAASAVFLGDVDLYWASREHGRKQEAVRIWHRIAFPHNYSGFVYRI